jgi:NitT/TauT family transport system substrate-binding protein
MALDQNFVTKEVKANGFGAVDMNRLDRSITQIGQAFTYTNRPSATDIFDGQYLPSKTERMLK